MNFIALRFMFDLLTHFWRHDIRCHIIGSIPTYLAGLQTGFHRVSFFISLKELPLINLIFQFGEALRDAFYIGHYHFTLYKTLPNAYVCMYVVRKGSLEHYFTFLGIDSIIECDTRSNIDFIHFVWRAIEAQYAFRRDAFALFPNRERFTIRLLCTTLFQLSVGPAARGVVSAMLRLVTRYALPPTAWHRLHLAAVISAHGVPITESPGFQRLFLLGAQYRAFHTIAARYVFTVSCGVRLGPC